MSLKSQLKKQLGYAKKAISSFNTVDDKITNTRSAVSNAADDYRRAIKCTGIATADLNTAVQEKSVGADGGLSASLQSSRRAKTTLENMISQLP